MTPGQMLKDMLKQRNWTQSDLADIIDRPYQTVNEICNDRERITPITAIELGAAFGVPAEMWLRLQSEFFIRESLKKHDWEKRAEEIQRKKFSMLSFQYRTTGGRYYTAKKGLQPAVEKLLEENPRPKDADIARKVGCSRERVRQIRNKFDGGKNDGSRK